MLKHLEDGGDLNIGISNDGAIIFVCSLCKSMWTGQFTPIPSTVGRLNASVGVDSFGAMRTLRAAIESNPSVLEDMGLDPEYVIERLFG